MKIDSGLIKKAIAEIDLRDTKFGGENAYQEINQLLSTYYAGHNKVQLLAKPGRREKQIKNAAKKGHEFLKALEVMEGSSALVDMLFYGFDHSPSNQTIKDFLNTYNRRLKNEEVDAKELGFKPKPIFAPNVAAVVAIGLPWEWDAWIPYETLVRHVKHFVTVGIQRVMRTNTSRAGVYNIGLKFQRKADTQTKGTVVPTRGTELDLE